MKPISALLAFCLLSSCIPLSIAPKIDTEKIKIARKFKKGLPNQYAFIFEDPKQADEFYYFINAKFDLNFELVESDVPFLINEKKYGLTFYEREKSDRTLNLIPIFIDMAINKENDEDDRTLEETYTSRKGHWYIILTVLDEHMKDGLSPKHKDRDAIINYLTDLREEYFTTNDYRAVQLRNRLIKH